MTEYLKTRLETSCYGCRACEQICPKGAISMHPNSEGFLYPMLDDDKCIRCGLCVGACPYDQANTFNPEQIYVKQHVSKPTNTYVEQGKTVPGKKIRKPLKAFAGQYKNTEALSKSSSGGIFSALSDYILENGGYVSGCIFNDKYVAIHTVTNEKDTVEKMRGSKYVQSDTLDTYTTIKALLENGNTVLFTGTPCQVDGLKGFLHKDFENLYTIDLICHGVPSPRLLYDYLQTVRLKDGEVTELTFRNKKRNGWRSAGTIGLNGKVKKISPFNNSYYNLYYLQNSVSRKSCYECKYACLSRVGDITIGDFWGAEEDLPEICIENGVSAVLVNTEKGVALLNLLRDKVTLVQTDVCAIAKNNGNLNEPLRMPESRNNIYERISAEGYLRVAKTDCRYQYVKPLLLRLMPKGLKRRIKKLLKRT